MDRDNRYLHIPGVDHRRDTVITPKEPGGKVVIAGDSEVPAQYEFRDSDTRKAVAKAFPVSLVAGSSVKICSLPELCSETGVYALKITWGGNAAHYWHGWFAAIIPVRLGQHDYYNASAAEPIAGTHFYHHRNVSAFAFTLESDNSTPSYGFGGIFVTSAVTYSDTFTVVLKKLMP